MQPVCNFNKPQGAKIDFEQTNVTSPGKRGIRIGGYGRQICVEPTNCATLCENNITFEWESVCNFAV